MRNFQITYPWEFDPANLGSSGSLAIDNFSRSKAQRQTKRPIPTFLCGPTEPRQALDGFQAGSKSRLTRNGALSTDPGVVWSKWLVGLPEIQVHALFPMRRFTASFTHRSPVPRTTPGGITCHVVNPNAAGVDAREEVLRRLSLIVDLCVKDLKKLTTDNRQDIGRRI